MPSLRLSSETLCSPRSPSSTIRIFSSGENFLRGSPTDLSHCGFTGLFLKNRHLDTLPLGVTEPGMCL